MPTKQRHPLGALRIVERVAPSAPALNDLPKELTLALENLALPAGSLREKRIAVAIGSRGIASINIMAREVCQWLKSQGARPFVFPAMGSHGGATAEGQEKILAEYGITPDFLGVDVLSSMEIVSLGTTPEGFQVFMDRYAWESDGVVSLNRVKPHTDFSGRIESGLLKMIAVGMGKAEGALECHHWSWKFGFEKVIRAMSAKTLASGKILAGVAVVENEFHQVADLCAASATGIAAMEESCLERARPLVARLPFPKLDLLIVDEMGKNISGTGLDTKIVGRGVELRPGEAPQIRLIYVRDLTPESGGNALGVGLADAIHERLYRKIDMQRMYANAWTSMNPPMPRIPMFLPSDQEALAWLLGALGSPEPAEQRVAWIRNTMNLNRIAISERLAGEAAGRPGWRQLPEPFAPSFDGMGNLAASPI
ncbi:MAG: lactate racemase domain-containing protein [Terriglobia bacterium]